MDSKPTRRSSFLLYFGDRLKELKERTEFRKISPASGKSIVDITAVTQAVGAEWKSLSDAARAKVEEQASKAKAEYEKALAAWKETLTPEDIRRQNVYYAHQRKLGKAVPSNLRDPAAPKRPSGAFFLFLQHLREEEKITGPVHVVAKTAGERWKKMTAQEKQPFELQAQAGQEKYTKDMEKYKSAQARS